MIALAALTTLFAAVAAVAALLAIVQQRRLHGDDVADRRREAEERREEFEREAATRERMFESEMRLRWLDQLATVSQLVANVRQTARDEAFGEDRRVGRSVEAPFFWNARKQLELGLAILDRLGGADLPRCRELATGSSIQFLSDVVSAATGAFDELAHAPTATTQLTAARD